MTKSSGAALAAIVSLAPFLASCKGETPAPPKQATAVVARPAARRSVAATTLLTGTVEARRTARLVAQAEGEVQSLPYREGDAVQSGSLLVRIDPARLQALLDEARGDRQAVEADLLDARRVLARDKTLFTRKGIGQESLEKTETGVARLEAALVKAKARIAGLAAQVAYTQVRAPFDGYVLERKVELGDVVRSGTPLVSIASKEAHVLVQVTDMDLSRVGPGDAVDLSFDAVALPCTGTVSRIRPQVDPVTRTAAVEVTPVTGCSGRFLPGMLVRATFTLDQRKAVVAVPAEAVATRPDGTRTLFVAEGETARLKTVTTGLEGGGFVEVVSGLAEGELVVVQGQEKLKDGAPISLKGKGGAKTPPAAVRPAARES